MNRLYLSKYVLYIIANITLNHIANSATCEILATIKKAIKVFTLIA